MLVPAFTSKGFPTFKRNGKKRSEVANVLEGTRTTIKESLLISAYDIKHGFIPKPDRYFRDKVLVFIDSGGYELSPYWDSTEVKQGSHNSLVFTEKNYRKVLKSLPEHITFIVANYDWGTKKKSIASQIRAAQDLFVHYEDRRFLTTFIIKPGQPKYLEINDVLPHLDKLRAFNCIGVVEKELGENLLERLKTVAQLRTAMSQKGLDLPIHVWGGLDPITTPLYFFAGADIFDGVSWLRYAYHNGMAVYRDSHCVINGQMGLKTSGSQAWAITLAHNLAFLGRLKDALCQFVDRKGRSFKMFDELSDKQGPKLSAIFQRAFDVLSTNVPGLRGGE